MALTGYGTQAWGADASGGGGGGDVTPPTVSISPDPLSGDIPVDQVITVTVGDDIEIGSLFITAKFGSSGAWELVHNGATFSPRFAAGGSISGTPSSQVISFSYPQGWPADVTIEALVADTGGNVAQASAAYTIEAAEVPPLVTEPTDVDGYLVTEGLRTAVLISLFSDRRAPDGSEVPAGDGNLRGWWGDEFAAVSGDLIGSRLWQLDRAKPRGETIRRAEEYTREALAWLLEDRVASAIDVAASIEDGDRIQLAIQVFRPSGGDPIDLRFDYWWDAERQGLSDVSIFEQAA